MRKKKSRLDIKKQLMAAISMLLISSLMMVTSTYAWFTLSTAPEVKGIQTSVGANGNLEIALLSTAASIDGTGITSAVGDSSAATGKSALTANITWGNLVDLSHDSYGLNFVKLLPAALDSEAGTISRNFLAVPTYGADGRVNELTPDGTQAGLYDTGMKAFVVPGTGDTTIFGLRGVGVSTNQTVRDMAYNSALNSATTATTKFKQAASTSLRANGGELANLASKKDGATIAATDVEVLWKILDNILGTRVYKEQEVEGGTKVQVWEGDRNENGIIQIGEELVASYVAAAFASELNETEYTTDEQFTTALESLTTDTDAVQTVIGWEKTGKLAALSTAMATLRSDVENAETTLKAAAANGSYTWSEISTVVTTLFDEMDIWDKPISELKDMATNNPNGVLALMQQYGQIEVNIKDGAYADMASIIGEFEELVYMDFTAYTGYAGFENTQVLLSAKSSVYPNRNTAVSAELTGIKYEGASTATTTSISDTYGYIVDLAFRTNASGSSLLLQTAAEKRVNATSTTGTGETDPIMGGGSCIKFRLADIQTEFGETQILNLLQHVKVVFFRPSVSGEQPIIGYAMFDTANPVKDTEYLTVNLYMCKSTVEGNTKEWDLTQPETDQTKAIITAMGANVATPISALVYLDGETIQNRDVATGALSMAGTLNLQFSSSAELVPMNYTAGYGAANEPTEPAATESTSAESTEATTEPTTSNP